MNCWLGLTLVTLTAGGGFMGCVVFGMPLMHSHVHLADATIPIGLALSLFVLVSGLIFVQKPARVAPLIAALAIQIPAVRTSTFAYQFGVGVFSLLGSDGHRVFGTFNLGAQGFATLNPTPPFGYA